MARNRIHIKTEGMKALENDFDRLAGPEPYEYAHERLNVAARRIFDRTQAFVPVGKGDKRRPAGALRDTGQFTTESRGDYWNATIQYGTHNDELPYAVWARFRHLRKTGIDFIAPTEDPDESIGQAMGTAFDDVFDKERA